MEAETLSFSDFARRLGVSKARVSQMKNEGKLVLTEDGRKVLVQASLDKISADTNPAKRQGVLHSDASAMSYQAAKALRERYLALRAKSEYEQSQGLLIEKALAASAIKNAMALVRANMEALPASLSAELAQVADEGAVYQLLSGQVEQALAAAAQQLRGAVSA